MKLALLVRAMFAASVLAGCLSSPATPCGERFCAPDQVCAPSIGSCVYLDQLSQCRGAADGTPCELAGAGAAACTLGVCESIGCGNGIMEAGEACDDGNTDAGDGCSANCDSAETCGNGIVDAIKGEACDCGGSDLANRPAGCNGPNSDAEGATCLSDCTIRGCGDLVASGLEDCDGDDLRGRSCTDVGFYGGTIGCLGTCRFDTTLCTGRCGDGVINGPPGKESCDQTMLVGNDCTDFGFYQPAGLKCNALCGFDTSSCSARCGDGIVNGSEQCDPLATLTSDCSDFGFYAAGGLACTAACTFDTSACVGRCGDGAVNGTEQCEPGVLGGKTCADFGFYQAAGLGCTGCIYDTSACTQRCGDGMLNGAEACDGTQLGGKTCLDAGYYAAPGLKCGAACSLDTSTCGGGRCGDGVKQSVEACDTTVPAGTDCTDLGYYNANPVTCTSACTLDASQCTGYCGDGTVNGPEDCDGTVPVGKTCQTQGFYGGTLACSSACRFDVAGCAGRCGDGTVNGTEQCETGQLGGKSCTDFGYYQASGLACTSCVYDTTACVGRCGDGTVNGSEQCEAGKLGTKTCTDFGYYAAPGLACSSICTFDVAGCGGGRCGDSVLQSGAGEVCDGSVPAGYDCSDFGYYAASGLACNNICELDDSACTGGRCGDHIVNPGSAEECDQGPPAVESCLFEGYDAGLRGCTGGCDVANSACRNLSFGVQYPGYFGASDLADFSEAGGTLFAVEGGRILENPGAGWNVVQQVTGLGSIWAASATQAFAASPSGYQAWRRNNGVWAPMGSNGSDLTFDIWGTSATNVFFVGSDNGGPGLTPGGLITKWNGAAFSVAAQGLGGAGTYLTGIWGSSPSVLYAVGFHAASLPPVYRSTDSGATWQAWTTALGGPPVVSGEGLYSISGTSANDIVIGSTAGIRWWNGTSWQLSTCVLDARVSAAPGRGAYATEHNHFVGGTTFSYGGVCYRAADTWVKVVPSITTDMSNGQGAMLITSNGHVELARTPELLESGGATWKSIVKPPTLTSYNSVWAQSPNEVYVAGDSGSERVLKWNGSAWSNMGLTASVVHALWGFNNGASAPRLYAVGAALSTFNGTTWAAPVSDGFTYRGVWGADTSNVWAVGDGGRIRKWTGAAWAATAETSNTAQALRDVFGFSATDVWAVGAGGAVVHKTDATTTWSAQTLPGSPNLNAVWGRASNDVYAVGDLGGERVAYRYNGASWSPMPIVERGGSLEAVWGTPEGDVLASGAGETLQLVGRRWIPLRTPAGLTIYDLFGGSGYLVVAGADASGNTAEFLGVLGYTTSEAGHCRDYWDDDGDGAIDCADSDCSADAWCSAGGSCRPQAALGCNQTYGGTTLNGPTKRSAYACGGRALDGAEAYLHFTRPVATTVTLTLSGYGANNLDLIVSGEQYGACIPDVSCLGASQTNNASEIITFSAAANTSYEVIVDGVDGAAGAFNLHVDCVP